MNNYLENLNEEQKLPVLHKDGPLIVIAGAGSGKTRVLTYRIIHLINEGVDPFKYENVSVNDGNNHPLDQKK